MSCTSRQILRDHPTFRHSSAWPVFSEPWEAAGGASALRDAEFQGPPSYQDAAHSAGSPFGLRRQRPNGTRHVREPLLQFGTDTHIGMHFGTAQRRPVDVAAEFAKGLVDHLDEVLEVQDAAIETISPAGPRTVTREEAIVEAMARSVASSERGEGVMGKSGWAGGSVRDLLRWFAEHGQMPLRKDPVDWRLRRARSVGEEGNRHWALTNYRSFVDQTAEVRRILDEAHAEVERYIDLQIQQWKEDRHT